MGNEWRVAGDITDDWPGVLRGLAASNDWAAAASPGHYNDPDMLEVGNGGLSADESRAHVSMWAMAGAPLVAGNDLRTMDATTLAILTNRDVIAIDQDPRQTQGTKVAETAEGLEVWSKRLAGRGVRAVAFFNPTATPASTRIAWDAIGLAATSANVRDLWSGAAGRSASHEVTVAPHAVVLLKVEGAEPPAPRGDAFVSDLPFVHAANYWGLVERDASVGERRPGDGHPLSIGGKRYAKGLGTHAPSDVGIRLGRACRRFEAAVGLDDETLFSGAAFFEVWADGTRLWTSEEKRKGAATPVSIDVTGKEELRLVTRGGGTTGYDHTDWADARVRCAP